MALLGRGGVANVYLGTFNTALYVVIWLEIVRSVEFLNIRLKSLKEEEIEARGEVAYSRREIKSHATMNFHLLLSLLFFQTRISSYFHRALSLSIYSV